jgi:hypothetical protein
MATSPIKAKAYLKDGCPFSFKFWLFMMEAGLGGQIEVIRCNETDPDFERTKAKLSAALGKPASFPIVEIASGRYESDSDRLIERYATQNGIDMKRLPLLAFYKETLLPQVEELHSIKEKGQ